MRISNIFCTFALEKETNYKPLKPKTRKGKRNMEKTKYYNRLIINSETLDCEGNERIFLFHANQLEEIAYNNEAYSYAQCYRVNEDGYMEKAEDFLNEDDFDELYYEADETDKDVEMFETLYDDEPKPFVKASWYNHDHYFRLYSQHGINTSYYYFDTDIEVISGVCYEANYIVERDYPHTENQNFFKFVADDGREFYIKKTSPFFADEQDDFCEIITKEEFEEYE